MPTCSKQITNCEVPCGKEKSDEEEKATPWLYSLPSMILVGIIVLFPIVYTGYISLTNMNLYHWTEYDVIGLKTTGGRF